MPRIIDELVAEARIQLRDAGIAANEAALDARLLARQVLGWDATRLFTDGTQPASTEFQRSFRALVDRRARREPMAYITGWREFWNLDIAVTPAVLVPRPETELLVESALDRCDRHQPLRIIDVCTGSGCVAVALATEFTRATLFATDISHEALAVAAGNLSRHQVHERVRVLETDLLSGIRGAFDLIVANPPYVPTLDEEALQPEVGRYEPHNALFAGSDGLDIVRRLLADAPRVLRQDGLLMFEFGVGQADAIRELIGRSPSLALVDIKPDLQGIPRVAVVRRT